MPGIKQSISMSSLSSIDRSDVGMSYLTQCTKNSATSSQTQREDGHSAGIQQRNAHTTDTYKRDASGNLLHKKKKRKRHLITANLTGTRYEVVRQMAEKVGFTITREDDMLSYVIWNDSFISMERISELKPYQKINHFPGMAEVTRKDNLARNFMKIQKSLPEDFGFVPKTWILPAEHGQLQNYAKELKARKKMKTFIIKPSNGAQGHGIILHRNAEKIPPTEHFIVQQYIDKPLLLDGYKFDLRVYVLVTSTDPLRVFLFNDGLVRLSTEKYLPPHESNLNRLYMHLTNYSVNKHNEHYEKSSSVDSGSKRSIRYLNDFLRKNDIDVAKLWRKISDMIVKTMLVAQPHVLHSYRMCRPGSSHGADSVCFEVLGFDVLIDGKLKPWLLEINRSPSFNTDERIDYDIKSALIEDTFRLLNIKQSDKRRNLAAQKAEAQKRLFRTGKKVEVDITEIEKHKVSIERRKEELKELLSRVRKTAAREEFENKNCGRFRRIFPCEDKARQEKYCSLLSSSFSVFMGGRGTTMQKEIQITYNNKYREDDILDMIAECEADEKEGKVFTGAGTRPRLPKPLMSMPECGVTAQDDEEDDDDEASENFSPPLTANSGRHASFSPTSRSRSQSLSSVQRADGHSSQKSPGSQPNSDNVKTALRSGSNTSDETNLEQHAQGSRSRSHSRMSTTQHSATVLQKSDDNILLSMVKEREEELTHKTLNALNEMRIKFPGKTDQEADILLDKV
ncbi:tubulin polyglutamylase TTLL7-like isoform X2 [Gigantopelta aegis]|uniref:tubulin polyglutamylase TTLL7-like isoform X2 n=1 Tax=Gigantopelta aegis TaxID=1735272 RepID=UPI001B88DCE5|nr:tubulin polyglutamylase TTLL7-like isoform X2 [Gigantopelta aegis]